jgi:hypothetical protein
VGISHLFQFAISANLLTSVLLGHLGPVVLIACSVSPLHPYQILFVDIVSVREDDISVAA